MDTNPDCLLLQLNIGCLSEIVTFVPLKQALQLRLVSRKLNQAVCYGWRLRIYQIEALMKHCNTKLKEGFEDKTVEDYKDMCEHQSCIIDDLNVYVENGFKFGVPRRHYMSIGYLVKPSRFITVPLLISMILLGWDEKIAYNTNFKDNAVILQYWYKFRINFRNKKVKKFYDDFDINKVTGGQVNLCKKILQLHPDLTFARIKPLSNCAANVFLWSNLVIKHFEIDQQIKPLGIRQIEDKIVEYDRTEKKMMQVFDRILCQQNF
ncbi:unnamed protein product [Moneuplotes crassus]|uniref:F-box domain-containing protein n=1 Tax=Euplotes crassus TaxID=5936 RepID=A0AAD1XSG9_EUPCR|nr:unnamed protein product [Moneuplotes crassus]